MFHVGEKAFGGKSIRMGKAKDGARGLRAKRKKKEKEESGIIGAMKKLRKKRFQHLLLPEIFRLANCFSF